jgi:hypothetical protein
MIKRTLDESNQLPGAPAQLPQRVPDAPGRAGDGRSRGAGDARQALRRLARRLLGGLGGLLRGGALEAAGGELPEGRGAEHRAREGHGHCRGHCPGCVLLFGGKEERLPVGGRARSRRKLIN